jgi:hypothetical protein
MPHVPRRYPSTTGVSPELAGQPTDQHPTIPVKGAQPSSEQDDKPAHTKMGLGRMNMRSYEPDFKQLCKAMLGKEAKIDEYTRQLVLDQSGIRAGALSFGADPAGSANGK